MNYIKVDQKKCKACYLCIEVCPKKLIKKSKEANSMGIFSIEFNDPNHECLGCAMCAIRCPDLAIIKVVKGKE